VITTQDVANRARELEVEASVLPASRENSVIWGVARIVVLQQRQIDKLEAEIAALREEIASALINGGTLG
jgi:hypothetical protein